MTIGKIINYYGDKHTPYVGRSLVNHLPMGQLAIYKISNDLEHVKSFTSHMLEKININETSSTYPPINTIEEAVGNREMYESCLDFVRRDLKDKDIDEYLSLILDKYKFGLSSGVFHAVIRLAYALEGYRLDPLLSKEVERSLAYYITAYRQSKLFTRKINGKNIKKEMQKLVDDKNIRKILGSHENLGRRIKALYNENDFMSKGFIIEGGSEEKIDALLDLLIPTYYFSGNIIALHCITGLHAVIVLKDYLNDYEKVLDILTTGIITHLLTIKYRRYIRSIEVHSRISWEAIHSVVADDEEVHAVKLSYSANELDKMFGKKGLKDIVIKRARH